MEIFIADSVGPLQKYEKRNHYRSIKDFFRYVFFRGRNKNMLRRPNDLDLEHLFGENIVQLQEATKISDSEDSSQELL